MSENLKPIKQKVPAPIDHLLTDADRAAHVLNRFGDRLPQEQRDLLLGALAVEPPVAPEVPEASEAGPPAAEPAPEVRQARLIAEPEMQPGQPNGQPSIEQLQPTGEIK